MRRFAELWPDIQIVQRSVAQLPWRHNICLMEKVEEPNRRLAYAMAAIEHGWSKTILELQLENFTLERTGKIPSNFGKTLPDAKSDIGVASWETAIEKDIADKWKSSLPTIEELEAELNNN